MLTITLSICPFRIFFSVNRPPDLYSQFVRFLLVGGFTALIDLLLLVLFVEAFSVYYLLTKMFVSDSKKWKGT